MPENTLYYGDNLDILRNREYFPDACVDLIYLDPPFNSNRSYNVLFKDESGSQSDAQIQAFDDTWHWGETAEQTLNHLILNAPARVSAAMSAMLTLIGRNQMLAYLVMMTARLVELHRVLKPTGSLYLHCDPTASHYLKMILDAIFDPRNFRNEIIWQRSTGKSLASRKLPNNHDVILCYQKTDQATWNNNSIFEAYDEDDLDPKTASKYNHIDSDGRRYTLGDLTNPNPNRPNLTYEFLGITKVWRWTKERMQKAHEEGLVIQASSGAVPRLKRYLDEQRGLALGDVWTDIAPLNSQAKERLGYPTQKPMSLLERIISASSNPGDVILDPFCGCGTAIAAAEKLGRRWLGIDITHLSIALLKYRMRDMFGLEAGTHYRLVGEPEDTSGARQLASEDRYQFQWWALSLVQAKPLGGEEGSKRGKKGSDKGVDGVIPFLDPKPGRVLVQVKSGKVKSGDIRDLVGTVEREKAAIGVFITLEDSSKEMKTEAISAGFYRSPGWLTDYPKIQILTIEDLLKGASIRMPAAGGAFKQADRVKPDVATQPPLL